ncbi:PTS transporter subunit EIIC, partial [Pseudomonas aeruginosa]|uniref:PTS transporter subunit EIIC n=1 Tax=Pseudomonas aeruginosa TaxID=287 RepID=UPI0031B6CF2C
GILAGPLRFFAAPRNLPIDQLGAVEAALAAGKTFHIWAKPMLDSFIFLGGSGATLGLILAIFIASRRADYRQVAKLALPSGIFQINEPILFGL